MKKYVKYVILFVILVMAASVSVDAAKKPDKNDNVIHYVSAIDQPVGMDRLLYYAYQDMGYNMTVDASAMAYAVQMTNSGERAGLVAQAAGLETEYTNLIRVDEPVGSMDFHAYVKKGNNLDIKTWADLSGLRVGALYQKKYVMESVPADVESFIQEDTYQDLFEKIANDECDVVIVTYDTDGSFPAPEYVHERALLEKVPVYTYLNKSQAALAAPLAKSLRELKKAGVYDEIMRGQYNPGKKKSVLHISSYHPEDAWDEQITQGLRETIQTEGTEYYNVPLYSDRFQTDDDRARNAYSAIRTMFLAKPVDVVVVSDNNALAFINAYYAILFPNIPVVYCGIDADAPINDFIDIKATGIRTEVSAAETVDVALDIYPDTKNIFVINGYFSKGQAYRKQIEEQLAAKQDKLRITYNECAQLDGLLQEIKALPEDTIILLGNFAIDPNDLYLTRTYIQEEICKATDLPVFSLLHCGNGEIGGKDISPELLSEQAADMALQILDGKDVADITPTTDYQAFNIWTFDDVVLKQRGIRAGQLPKDYRHVNRIIPFYERYPLELSIVALIVIAILAGTFFISWRKASQATLAAKKADATKTVFLSKISHELRTPLNAITGMVQLGEQSTDETTIKKSLSTIKTASDQLLAMIKDILEITSAGESEYELESRTFRFEAAANNICRMMEGYANEKNQEIKLDLKNVAGAWYIGDELRTIQVMNNLLDNAIKFSPEHSTIYLGAEEVEREGNMAKLRVWVKDSGIGMKPEEKDRVFEAFEQADDSITRKNGGSGLGLTVCRNIIKKMGGTMWVETEFEKGSAFFFEIMLECAQMEGHESYDISGVSLLLVDDIEINREVFIGLFEDQDITIDTAQDGYQAIEKFKENPGKYDAIIMDIQMPNMNGYDATQAIRALPIPAARKIPIIALTANAYKEDIEKCLAAGMNDHIEKPVNVEVVLKVISKYV